MAKTAPREPKAARGAALLVAVIGLACAAGPGGDFIKAGDDALRGGRASDALAAYDQAAEEGATESRLRSRREKAQGLLVDEKVAEADRLEAEGDHAGALDMLLAAQALDPGSQSLNEALQRHGVGWVERAKAQADNDDRATALRTLARLEAVYPQMPGLAETRSQLVSEWTEILLNRARDAERQDRPAIALLNWAILAALNPEETGFAAELNPLRQRLLETLSVRTALFLGSMNAQAGLDPDVDILKQQLSEALIAGELGVEGVAWVERAFGEPGPAVTVSTVGEISSSDVERGEGVYRVLLSSREVPNPEIAKVDMRAAEIEAELAETARLIDKYDVSYKHSEGPSRTKMQEAMTRAQGEFDKLTAELYDLGQRRLTLPGTVSEPTYTEYAVEDEVHSRRIEVTLEVKVLTGDGDPQSPAYLVGLGEEKDLLRLGDAARGIPEDPLVFSRTDDQLRALAIADALFKARRVISVVPQQAGAQWLAHAQRSERADDLEEAARAYVHHVLLMPDRPAEAALFFLAGQGLPSPSLLRGERQPMP